MNEQPWIAMLEQVTTSSVSDALMKRGLRQFMHQRIKPLGVPRIAGRALTVERLPIGSGKSPVLPNSLLIDAIEQANEGTVLVFNAVRAEDEAALWGGLMATAAVQAGLGGIVADGPVRDPDEIKELGCACYCTGAVPAGQAGILELTGVKVPLRCGGVLVHSGDFILGDASGVVVIPSGLEDAVLQEAAEIEHRDQLAATRLKQGARLSQVMQSLGRA
ncbi:RraA family protein [Bordetella sp. BOR01]|uniref:RraA family protein n=1 Tax=Bordetella sp. BOR01 TaxID=2854779 RepID=UPI001C449616|nr:hypothetical protein [Bordetella sp. BOR01]MBV7484627.1 hypothetical protein [Bordetella sp. BOR01]